MTLLYSEYLKSTGVQTDTRKITQNCLFFCLKGANFNGNTFAAEALANGAFKVIIDDAQFEIPGKTILVNDTLVALQELANEHRKTLTIPIIGITGSNGKTTSKELIGTVLATQFNTYFTKGNLNNHIGVPLSLLELTAEHEIAVIEMGANKPGDIDELMRIAEPTHGIITNIGRAHLEGFGSLEGVIQTKTEMYRFLAKSSATLFVNKIDSTLTNQLPTNCSIQYYGKESELNGELIRLSPFVEMTWQEENYESPLLKTHLVGEYNFTNFLAAIRIGRFFGITRENCNKAITSYEPTNNRSQISKTINNTLIVDCYNANPTSMAVALTSFAKIDNHAKIFILGDMLEMGDDAAMVHEEIVQQTINLRLSGFFIGEEFLRFKGIHPQAIFLKSIEPLIEHFEHNPPTDLLILLKGSRGLALEKVIPYL